MAKCEQRVYCCEWSWWARARLHKFHFIMEGSLLIWASSWISVGICDAPHPWREPARLLFLDVMPSNQCHARRISAIRSNGNKKKTNNCIINSTGRFSNWYRDRRERESTDVFRTRTSIFVMVQVTNLSRETGPTTTNTQRQYEQKNMQSKKSNHSIPKQRQN